MRACVLGSRGLAVSPRSPRCSVVEGGARCVPFLLALFLPSVPLIWPGFRQIWVSRCPTRFDFGAFFRLLSSSLRPGETNNSVAALFFSSVSFADNKITHFFSTKQIFSMNLCSIYVMPLEIARFSFCSRPRRCRNLPLKI